MRKLEKILEKYYKREGRTYTFDNVEKNGKFSHATVKFDENYVLSFVEVNHSDYTQTNFTVSFENGKLTYFSCWYGAEHYVCDDVNFFEINMKVTYEGEYSECGKVDDELYIGHVYGDYMDKETFERYRTSFDRYYYEEFAEILDNITIDSFLDCCEFNFMEDNILPMKTMPIRFPDLRILLLRLTDKVYIFLFIF